MIQRELVDCVNAVQQFELMHAVDISAVRKPCALHKIYECIVSSVATNTVEKTKLETGNGNQTTAPRFQTGKEHQTSLASLRGHRKYHRADSTCRGLWHISQSDRQRGAFLHDPYRRAISKSSKSIIRSNTFLGRKFSSYDENSATRRAGHQSSSSSSS